MRALASSRFLRAGTHQWRGLVDNGTPFGTENQGGYPCVMNGRRRKFGRHAARARSRRSRSRARTRPRKRRRRFLILLARRIFDLVRLAGVPADAARLPALHAAGRPDRGPLRRSLVWADRVLADARGGDGEAAASSRSPSASSPDTGTRRAAPRPPPAAEPRLVFTGDARWKFNHSIKMADVKCSAPAQRSGRVDVPARRRCRPVRVRPAAVRVR